MTTNTGSATPAGSTAADSTRPAHRGSGPDRAAGDTLACGRRAGGRCAAPGRAPGPLPHRVACSAAAAWARSIAPSSWSRCAAPSPSSCCARSASMRATSPISRSSGRCWRRCATRHRAGLRRRHHRRRPSVLRDGVHRRQPADAVRERTRAVAASPHRTVHPHLRRRAARAPEGRHPPRPQARQHPGRPRSTAGRCRRSSTSASPARPRPLADGTPTRAAESSGTPRLHEPGAGRRRCRRHRHPHRRLLARRGALRIAHRPSPRVRGRDRRPAKATTLRLPSEQLATLPPGDADRVARGQGLSLPRMRRMLRHELDWVVLKAMRHDRNDRYPSAAALAEDLSVSSTASRCARCRRARLCLGQVRAPPSRSRCWRRASRWWPCSAGSACRSTD